MDFGADCPRRAGGAVLDLPDDVLRRSGVVGGLDDVPRHLGMDDDADARMLRAEILDLTDGEPRVDRAMSLPQNDARALHLIGVEAAENLVRIPHDHVVERNAHLVRGIPTEMLVREKENALTSLPGPLQCGAGVRRGADHAAAFAAERLN